MFFPPNLGITSPFVINSTTSSPLFQEFSSIIALPEFERIHSQFSRAKTNGYARITSNATNSRRSRSIDFGELSFQNHTPKKLIRLETTPTNNIAKMKMTIVQDSILEHDDKDVDGGDVFGIVLGQILPAAVSQNKVMIEPQNSSFRSVCKKSLSFKRSSSVFEGYSRMHHDIDLTTIEDNDLKSRSKKKRGGKFFKACRRFFRI